MEFWVEFIQENVISVLTMIATILLVLKSVAAHFKGITDLVRNKAENADIQDIKKMMGYLLEVDAVDIKTKLQSKIIPEELKEELREAYKHITEEKDKVGISIEEAKEKLEI